MSNDFSFIVLGGNLGLFTGMSILSIVEIGFWISRMLFGTRKKNRTMNGNEQDMRC